MDETREDVEYVPWLGYDELARLLGEPVDPSADAAAANDLADFSWLVDDDLRAGDDQSSSSVPVSPVRQTGEMFDERELEIGEESLLKEVMMADEDVEAAVELNRSCQRAVQEMIEAVQEELEQVARCLWRVREFRTSHPLIVGTAKTILDDPMGVLLKHAPDLTTSQKDSLTNLQRIHSALNLRTNKWTREQRRQLAKGVRQQNQKIMMDRVMETGGPLSVIQVELERIRQIQDDKCLEENREGLDFEKISRLFVPKKTAKECELQWLLVDHPAINHSEHWTEQEIKALKEAGGNKALYKTWQQVADRIGTNRTPFACLCQYQRLFQPHLNRGKWHPEEDELLKLAVKRHGEVDWTRIASFVPHRTPQQCIHRWRNTLAPTIRRGRWTQEEDRLLREAVMSNPTGTWQQIAQSVPGRTDVKCRERWANVLDPNIKRGSFTAEEDNVLRKAVLEGGEGKWAAVAALLPGRTDSQCRRRWRLMQRDDRDIV